MSTLQSIRSYLDHIEEHTFRRALFIALGIVGALTFGLIAYYYYTTSSLVRQIEDLNEQRETVNTILSEAAYARQQRANVKRMLSENEDFKISGYFKDVTEKLGLSGKKETQTTAQADRDDAYREVTVNATFADMNMQELAELLQELEKTERIYTKDLQIGKSSKKPGTIKVTLTIGTLLAKGGE